MRSKIIYCIAIFLGVSTFANGVFMIVAPESWYWVVPGVPDRGPFNQHFVRDIGINYALIGVSFICGAVYRKYRSLLWLFPTAWLAGHAVFHVWEVFVGICGPESLIEDFAGVTLPALLAMGIVYMSYRAEPGE
ncbi:hypothetical protein [Pseudoteredinibacter isoporae]|uniref:Uncharacterized protein n=1 Tax=Pseudoteredinibacter isoporae TaxID=570281 RepID=A0A7X0JTX9_9GAMM|nr:hypothetical protein [Pseudoteredinibacter isoporae]MBB6521271.1 hypothetical protein [Pseudoteredinibacter isoporae]NHO86829.1 hypothetical protein [Pseudoteredinibacter isoporae]NIB24719.1 hypothetical protein [Pseudoteredinibacter isoporae]